MWGFHFSFFVCFFLSSTVSASKKTQKKLKKIKKIKKNQQQHLMTFLELGEKKGPLFRAAVVVAQGVMWNFFFLLYLASPNTAHAFVGFLEEEAVKTYTHALQEIDAGRLWPVDGPVKPPAIAVAYWKLPEDASMRDVILAIRAGEMERERGKEKEREKKKRKKRVRARERKNKQKTHSLSFS